jgi:hypothetical protein
MGLVGQAVAQLVEPLTAQQARELYARAGATPPAELGKVAEHIRGTVRKEIDGHQFRSSLEARAYQILKQWEAAGVIRNLVLQPRFVVQDKFRTPAGEAIREMGYTADFQFDRPISLFGVQWFSHETVVVEAKGHRTQPFEMRRKMFLKRYPELKYEIWDKAKVWDMERGSAYKSDMKLRFP